MQTVSTNSLTSNNNKDNAFSYLQKDGSIYINIANPNYGSVNDLMRFYSIEYFDMIGIHPTIYINNNQQFQQQTGGENNNTSTNDDKDTVPYIYISKFLDIFFRVKPIDDNKESIFKETFTKSLKMTSMPLNRTFPETQNENTNISNDTKNKQPYTQSNGSRELPNLFEINPTKTLNPKGDIFEKTDAFDSTPVDIKDPTGDIFEKTDAFNSTPVDIKDPTGQMFEKTDAFDSTPIDMTQTSNITIEDEMNDTHIVLKFDNKTIVPMSELMKERDFNMDIDISPQKFKYQELKKIIDIKNKKNTDIYLDEIYYIDDILIVFKGISIEGKTPLSIDNEIKLFD